MESSDEISKGGIKTQKKTEVVDLLDLIDSVHQPDRTHQAETKPNNPNSSNSPKTEAAKTVEALEVKDKIETRVVARSAFLARKPSQLSFAKGDVIKVLSDAGKWHSGVLVESRTGQSKLGSQGFYPPNYVKPYVDKTNKINKHKDSKQNENKQKLSKSKLNTVGAIMRAKGAYNARKPNQLSFAKGDLIRVVKATGKWDTGVLHKSDKYSLTNEKGFFPANFVGKYDQEESTVDRAQMALRSWAPNSL